MITKEELNNIKSLQEICEKKEGYQLKLNFEMLKNRSENRTEDFFHYEEGQLVGFLGSYRFGNKVELCGMVHPAFRKRGIFSKLLERGLSEVLKQNTETVLINAPAKSQSAKRFLKNVPCTFSFSEHQMRWHKTEIADVEEVMMRPSFGNEDWEAEIKLDVLGFGLKEREAREVNEMERKRGGEQRLLIEVNGQIAGKMRISESNGEAWIYSFAIFPELQRKGIGRRALAKAVNMEHQKGFSIYLEVEAKNANALRLYESCGFRSYHSQDYYRYEH